MTSTANEIVVQSQAGVTHDVEALVQAAVSVLTNDIQLATHDQGTVTSQHDQNTVQLLVDTCATNNIQDRLYMCTDCNLAFYGDQGEQEWQWHLKQHKPYKCDLCSEAFEQKESLKTHMRSHTMQMPFICDKCGSAYTLKSNLTQHMKIHDDKLYQCAECNVIFKSQVNLEKHMKFHTGETIKVFQCEHCSKTFSQQKNLVQHMKIHMNGDKTYKCSECPASYSYKCHLTRHLMIHTGDKPYKCKFCGKSFNRNAHLIRHRKIHSGADKEWKCTQCGFAFWEKSDLIRHIKSHEGNRPFKCEFCEQTFVWKRYLLKHLNNHHRGEDRHFCQDCCRSFPTMEDLAEHDAKDHSNKKQLTHTCDICNQEFYFKYKLDEHMFIHTGRKAHACEKCSQKFVSRKELDRHIAEHAQEVSFHCNTCEKTFSSISQLQQHVKLHTGDGKYPCSICGASFRWKSQLTSHMVVHSTDYEFTCSVCNKQFKRKRDLTRHIKIYHDTKPPYTCVECNQDFHSPYNLHKHKTDTHWKRMDFGEEFACTHCTGVFRIRHDLMRHLTKVHPPRPFVCTICNKRFTMMKFLEKHFELKHDSIALMEGENYEVREVKDHNSLEIGLEEVAEEKITEEVMEVDQQVGEVIGEGSEQVIVFENVEELNQGEEFRELEKVTLEHAAAHGDGTQTIVEHVSNMEKEHLQTETSITDIDMQQQPLSEAITLAHLSQQPVPVYIHEIASKANTENPTVYKIPIKHSDPNVVEQVIVSSAVPMVSQELSAVSNITSIAHTTPIKTEPPKLVQMTVPSAKSTAQVISQIPQVVSMPQQPRIIKIQARPAQAGQQGSVSIAPKVQQIKLQRIVKATDTQGKQTNIKIIQGLPTSVQNYVLGNQGAATAKVTVPVSSVPTENQVVTYGDNIAVDAQLIASLVNSASGSVVSGVPESVVSHVNILDQAGFTSTENGSGDIVKTEAQL